MSRVEDTLYIVMPAYNEGDNIVDTVNSWMPVLKGKSSKSRLVIADSGSTDNTHKLLLSLRKKYPQLEILEKTNQYHGPKVIALYKYAIKNGADYVFQTDSDGQTNPAEFDAFWDERKNYDAVIGHRNERGDGKVRALVEKVVCFLLRLFFSVRVPDANAPFRLMKASLVNKYINKLPDEYDLPNIMLTAYFARFNENITFKTVSFKPRTAGTNSINLKKIFKTGKDSLTNFLHFRKDMKKMDPKNAKKITLHKVGTLAIVFSFVVAALLAISVSPSSPWNRSEPITDSSVFLTVGTQMKAGQTPYIDTFDHKGPVLYIINYLGVLINPTSGILVFEFVALFVAAVYMYKISRLFLNKRSIAWFLTLATFSLYVTFNITDRGNLTEEYAFPFIAMALYEFMRYLLHDKTSFARVFMVGVGFAAVLMLRVNMVAIWGVFGLVISIKMICEKEYKELLKFVISFFSGVLVVIVPIIIWLASKGALSAFVDVYIMFNAAYAKDGGAVSTILTAEYFLKQTILLVGLILAGYFACTEKEKKMKIALWIYLVAFVVAILAASISGRQYPHYGMVLIPLPIVSFAILYRRLDNYNGSPVTLLLTIILVTMSYQPWLKVSETAFVSYRRRGEGEAIAITIRKSCEYIEKYTNPDDRIAVYGNLNYVYLRCNRLPISRYSYQYPIGKIRPAILDEFFEDVRNGLPKVFVVQGGYVDDRVKGFLSENHYTEVWRDGDGTKTVENENKSRIYILR